MTPSSPTSPGVVKLSLAQNAYERLQAASDKESLPFDQVVGSGVLSERLDKVAAYQSRLLVTKDESPQGHMFINGRYFAFSAVSLLESLVSVAVRLICSNGRISYRTN